MRILVRVLTCLLFLTRPVLPADDKKPAAQPRFDLENSLGVRFAKIPAGEFVMGSPVEETYRRDNESPHRVVITKAFYLGIHEVTQEQFQKVMEYNPSCYSLAPKGLSGVKYNVSPGQGAKKLAGLHTGKFPVENISWLEAVEFCRRLSELPSERTARRTYRLPTEAEWEYACRGGAKTNQVFSFGNELTAKLANCGVGYVSRHKLSGALPRTTTVGNYAPNLFGLYDMHGNVSEWCADWYDENYYRESPVKDPKGPLKGKYRVARGGHRQCVGSACRSAARLPAAPENRYYQRGFRIVCESP